MSDSKDRIEELEREVERLKAATSRLLEVAMSDPKREKLEAEAREWLRLQSCELGHIFNALPPEGSESAYFDELLGGSTLQSLVAFIERREREKVRKLQEELRDFRDNCGGGPCSVCGDQG